MSISSRLSVKTVFASFLTLLRSSYHGPTTPTPQTAAAAASQPPLRPQDDIESGGRTVTTHNQHNVLPSMGDVVIPLTICAGVYPSIPPSELLVSHPLRYSPLLASVCLAVLAAGLSLVWSSTYHCHGRRRRSIEVAVASSIFAYLLRILLLLPNESLAISVGGFFFFLGICFAAVYVLLLPRQLRDPTTDHQPHSVTV